MPRFFPSATAENRAICLSSVGAKNGFSVLMANVVPDLQIQFNGQCFPLFIFDGQESESEDAGSKNADLFAAPVILLCY